MKPYRLLFVSTLLLAFSTCVWAWASRNWQTGTLVEMEQTKVLESTTHHRTAEGSASQRGSKTSYSTNSTSQSVDNYDTFQNYTVDAGDKRYVAREQLLFPWSKPVDATVGEKIKFAVEKNKLYLTGNDGKEHKATIVKVSLKQGE